jgi:nucleotide-binding universal stress UspA family protein
MSIKTILVPMAGGTHSAVATQCALSLAKLFDAHVTGLHVRPDPRAAIPYIGEGMTADVIQQLCEAAERDGLDSARAARESFEAARQVADVPLCDTPGTDGVSARWAEEMGAETDVIACYGRLADLTVIDRAEDDDEDAVLSILESLLFVSGRPILVAPAVNPPAITGGTAVITWNGSMEAARAVAFALPFLAQAKRVVVLSAGKTPVDTPSVKQLRQYLAWHQIDSEGLTLEKIGDPTGQLLLDKSHELGAGLVIMGAYTHSRWREMILGGVTRFMLEKGDIPVLMSH